MLQMSEGIPRAKMEASEMAEPPREGSSHPPLRRVERTQVQARLAADGDEDSGFARLELMLNTILPRLTRTGSK